MNYNIYRISRNQSVNNKLLVNVTGFTGRRRDGGATVQLTPNKPNKQTNKTLNHIYNNPVCSEFNGFLSFTNVNLIKKETIFLFSFFLKVEKEKYFL